jgi:drug/metabolite transporter (DMT)-like permease
LQGAKEERVDPAAAVIADGPVTPQPAESGIAAAVPAVIAAVSFACVSVFGKMSFAHGADVPTFLAFRGLLGMAVIGAWLYGSPVPRRFLPREKAIALVLGLLFAGNVFSIFKAIERIPVPIAELTYFVYPLLTGLLGALTGLERMSARGVIAAVVAFGGLALMIGSHSVELSALGLAFAVAAALFRSAMLLLTRAALPDANPRIISWYTIVSSTVVFAGLCLATSTWNLPHGAVGWGAFLWASLAAAIALLALFISAGRIGPFRTALVMNAEPLAAILLSAAVLGETINAVQWLGAAIMLGALVWFQLKR